MDITSVKGIKGLLFSLGLMLSLIGCGGNKQGNDIDTRDSVATKDSVTKDSATKDSATKDSVTKDSVTKDDVEKTDTALFVSHDTIFGVPFIVLRMNHDIAYVAMADSVMPSMDDPNIFLCVEAAFTGKLLKNFKSTNVAGDYVVDGRKRKGYKCEANTGHLFADPDGRVVISENNVIAEHMKMAEQRGGTLFQQIMLLKAGKNVCKGMNFTSKNIYRAACWCSDPDGFAIIQSESFISLRGFIIAIQKLGASDALYLDMGRGWNYGWYRVTRKSEPIKFFDYRTPYQTNWLVIRSK